MRLVNLFNGNQIKRRFVELHHVFFALCRIQRGRLPGAFSAFHIRCLEGRFKLSEIDVASRNDWYRLLRGFGRIHRIAQHGG